MTAHAVLAFDFGLKRIGIASGDTLTRAPAPRPAAHCGDLGPDWDTITREVRALAPQVLVVGAPYNADGSEGTMSAAARRFAAELERRFALPVHLVDERFSSLEANEALKAQRTGGQRRRRVQRADIDSAAAAVILGRWFAGGPQAAKAAPLAGENEADVRRNRRRRFGPIDQGDVMPDVTTAQLRPDGSLRHLLTLESLSRTQLEALLERAAALVRPLGTSPAMSQALSGATVANLFTEPSTRTRVSFELAAKRLGAQVVNLEMQLSSRVKGESMLDTVYTLQSMQVDAFVIRDAEAGVPQLVATHVAPHVSVLSAGEAHLSHPTQGLLDALTIRQSKPRFEGLSVAIVGDIRHSRVARSDWQALRTLGVTEVRLVAPPALMPDEREFAGAARYTRLEDGLKGADVIIMLRIQKERMGEADLPDGARYFAAWGLTPQRLTLARPDAVVMHPQPMNRGIEIASEVADGPQSLIRDQVRNGVAVRMAVLETVLGGRR